MNRFFAFGCSFTNYCFPTWADLISDQFDQYQNWGKVSAGNTFHFHSLIECHQRHTITANDTVIICWSNTGREDRYVRSWIGGGNIYSQDIYDDAWVKKFITERGCMVRDFGLIKAAAVILKSIGCNYYFLSTVPMYWHDELHHYTEPTYRNSDVVELYQNSLTEIKPSFLTSIFDNQWQQFTPNGDKRDMHPSPLEHAKYLQLHTPFVLSDAMQSLAEKETLRFFDEPIFKMMAKFGNYKSPWTVNPVTRL